MDKTVIQYQKTFCFVPVFLALLRLLLLTHACPNTRRHSCVSQHLEHQPSDSNIWAEQPCLIRTSGPYLRYKIGSLGCDAPQKVKLNNSLLC